MSIPKGLSSIIGSIPLLFIISLFTLSCQSDGLTGSKKTQDEAISYREYTYGGTTFSYSPLTPEYLENTHGLNGRYFTESPGLFPPRIPCIINFSITAAADREIIVLYDEALLSDETGAVSSSFTREEFYAAWKDKIAPSLQGKLNWLIDHNIHKKNIIIPAGDRKEGYFVFPMTVPRWGDFLMTVPVIIKGQRGTLSLPVTLETDRPKPAVAPEGSRPVFIPDGN